MSFSSWFNTNEELVNSVAGLAQPAPSTAPRPPPMAVAGQEPARMDPGNDDGGMGRLMQIAGLVGAIYTGGATAAVTAGAGVAAGAAKK